MFESDRDCGYTRINAEQLIRNNFLLGLAVSESVIVFTLVISFLLLNRLPS